MGAPGERRRSGRRRGGGGCLRQRLRQLGGNDRSGFWKRGGEIPGFHRLHLPPCRDVEVVLSLGSLTKQNVEISGISEVMTKKNEPTQRTSQMKKE